MPIKHFWRSVEHIRRHPFETIELILASVLFIFAVYVMIPLSITKVPTEYPNYGAKIAAGWVMIMPTLPIFYWRIKAIKDINKYLHKVKGRRLCLFWISVVFWYIGVLRALSITLFPPIFILYIALGTISGTSFLWLGIDKDEF